MKWRLATTDDVPLLAGLNRQLREDEVPGAGPFAIDFEEKMRARLAGEYTAVVFELLGNPVAYALYRANEAGGIFIRQFFVVRDRRREGLGRAAFELLTTEVLPHGSGISLEVLEGNTAALAFWSALGFSPYARALVRSGH